MPRFPLAIAVVLGTMSYANASTLAEAEQGVQSEFRGFRIQVYNTFHRTRPEFDRRRAAGEQALSAWKQAGGQAHQAETLVQWYREAKVASLPTAAAELPPLPEFPAAVAVEPTREPAAAVVHKPRSSQPPKDTGVYRVREVASRSVTHPENVPGDARDREKSMQKKSSNTVWASVSRALLKSISLGGNGSEEK